MKISCCVSSAGMSNALERFRDSEIAPTAGSVDHKLIYRFTLSEGAISKQQ